jgi:hypothetical protein
MAHFRSQRAICLLFFTPFSKTWNKDRPSFKSVANSVIYIANNSDSNTFRPRLL